MNDMYAQVLQLNIIYVKYSYPMNNFNPFNFLLSIFIRTLIGNDL